MTVHPLSPDGFRYLIESVTRQDESVERVEPYQRIRGKLAEYYLRTGNPAGQWIGCLAPELGLVGPVTESQMERLFGRGQHPISGEQLGRRYGRFTPLDVRVTERIRALAPPPERDRAGREWDAAELSDGELAELDGYALAALEQRSGRRISQPNADLVGLDGWAQHAVIRAQEQRRGRDRVAGVDLVFSPPKSVQSLWALATITGDAATRDRVEGWVTAARDETLRRLETQVAFGRLGAGGRVWVPADGVAAAAFLHRCSRAGDPNLHWHVAVASKVRVRDEQDRPRWVALDTRVLHKAAVSLSEMFNGEVERLALRDGYRFAPRRDQTQHGSRAVRELLGIPAELNRAWSRRRAQVEGNYERLLADFRAGTGRDPQPHEQYRLAQQACLIGRPAKTHGGGPAEEVAFWEQLAREVLGADADLRQVIAATRDGATTAPIDERVTARLRRLQHAGTGPDPDPVRPLSSISDGELAELDGYALAAVRERTGRTVTPDNAGLLGLDGHTQRAVVTAQEEAATPGVHAADITPAASREAVRRTVEAVAESRAWWTVRHLHAEAERQSRGIPFATAADRQRAVSAIVTAATTPQTYLGGELGLVVRAERRSVVAEPARLLRGDGDSAFREPAAVEYTTTGMLRAEDRVLRAARARGAPRIAPAAVEQAIARAARRGRPLAADQQAAVRALAGSGRWLDLLIGPAGAGKTTTLRVLIDAAHADGWTVIGLAPSANAAKILGDQTGARTVENTRQWQAHLTAGRVTPGPRTLVLIDEATLGHTPTLEAITTAHINAGGLVRLIGDPRQLPAPGAGGLMRWLHQQHGAVELTSLWRFRHEWEAAATLRLRDGDVSVVQTYLDHDRIRHGTAAAMKDGLYQWWLAQRAAGRTALMLVQSNADMADLSERARADLIAAGHVEEGGTRLRDGNHAGRGDQIVTRHIDRQLRYHRGKDHVRNGDVWQVLRRHRDGSLTARHATNHGRIRLTADWLEQWAELAYAVTAARAQGMTVHAAGSLLHPESTSRNAAYVQLTRGTHTNLMFLITDTVLDPDGEPVAGPNLQPRAAMAAILGRVQDDTVAHERLTEATHTEQSIRTLTGCYRYVFDLLTADRDATTHAAAALDPDRTANLLAGLRPALAAAVAADPAWPALAARLQTAATLGRDPAAELAAAAATRQLATATSAAQVLHWRLGNQIPGLEQAEQDTRLHHTHAPHPRGQRLAVAPWLPTPPTDTPSHLADLGGYLHRTQAAIQARAAELAATAAATRPPWTTALGPLPPPGPHREGWLALAARIAAYRDAFTIDDPRPLGELPPGAGSGQHETHRELTAALADHRAHSTHDETTRRPRLPGGPETFNGTGHFADQPDTDAPITALPPAPPALKSTGHTVNGPNPAVEPEPWPSRPYGALPEVALAEELVKAERAATRAREDADTAQAHAASLITAAESGHGPAVTRLHEQRDALAGRLAAITAAEPIAAAYHTATDDLAALEHAHATLLRRLAGGRLNAARSRDLAAHAAAIDHRIQSGRTALDASAERLGHATAAAGPPHEWDAVRHRHTQLTATFADALAAAHALDRSAAQPWHTHATAMRDRAAHHTQRALALRAEQHLRRTMTPAARHAEHTARSAAAPARPTARAAYEPDIDQLGYAPPQHHPAPHQPTPEPQAHAPAPGQRP